MKRLELTRVRMCRRCGRSAAELRAVGGAAMTVPLDPTRAREIQGEDDDGLRGLTAVVLEHFGALDVVPSEVVLHVVDGRLHALLSLGGERDAEPEVVHCPADEGLALALRGGIALYATDEALAHAAARAKHRHGGADVLH